LSARAALYQVKVRRGATGTVEATHWATAVSWRGEGPALPESPLDAERYGTAGLVTYFRSSCKPFQALPLVERGHAARFGFDTAELAVLCASHNGAAIHVDVVRGILDRIGLDERALLCGFHFPEDPENDAALRAGTAARSPLYNNCSGKHAGMLALALAEGWPIEDYVAFDHPVQRAGLDAVADVCGVEAAAMPLSIDGCSAASPALPLAAMARGFARFASAREGASDARERALATLRRAMAERPELVAGERRLCTDIMRATRGAVVTKTGAEGLQCAAIPAQGLGVAVKVHDGARRAIGPAVVAFLDDEGGLDDEARRGLATWRRGPHRNHRGTVVGEITAERVEEYPFPVGAPAAPRSTAAISGV
jgi:L-asparaginase II